MGGPFQANHVVVSNEWLRILMQEIIPASRIVLRLLALIISTFIVPGNRAGGTGPISISEFMADNLRTLRDEDGDSSDWIEIHNAGNTPTSLAGWSLNDQSNGQFPWYFPNVILQPQSFLIVFASGKNRTNALLPLHASFKLAANGEYLALFSPDGSVASEFSPAFPKQFADQSYGHTPSGKAGYFHQITPGTPNTDNAPGFASQVRFSHSSGTFSKPFDLTLTADSPTAVIRYTLTGKVPSIASLSYSAPFRITNSVQVRARAFEPGLLPSLPTSHAFLLVGDDLADFSSDLPVIIIHTLGNGPPSSSEQKFAHLSIIEPLPATNSFSKQPTFTARTGIKIRGASTESAPKSSFAIELWDEFDRDTKREILGLPAESDWVLYGTTPHDAVLILNPFMHQLSRDLGRYSSRTRFVEVFLVKQTGPVALTNYNGVYVLEEKIKIGKNRLDIDKLQPEQIQLPELSGGYVLKVDFPDPGDKGFSIGEYRMAFVDPKETEILSIPRAAQAAYITNHLLNFTRMLSSPQFRDPAAGYAAWIDVPSWIDYHILQMLSANIDVMVKSTYLFKPRNGKLQLGPLWDFDFALTGVAGSYGSSRSWGPTAPRMFNQGWWGPLFRDIDFWQQWIDRYQMLRRSELAIPRMHQIIDRLSNEVRQAQPREQQRWNPRLRGITYDQEVLHLKNWVSNRVDYFDQQLVAPPILLMQNDQIILAASNPSTVFFTLDGTDPRRQQGEVSNKAQPYTAPLTVKQPLRIVARSFNTNHQPHPGPNPVSPWSSPVSLTVSSSSSTLEGDTDHDGLPDAWENLHGLDPRSKFGQHGSAGDPDGDGSGNLDEFLAGTLPTQASSSLKLYCVLLPNAELRFWFVSVAQHSYTLECSDAIGATNWFPCRFFNPSIQNARIEFNEPTPPRPRFYRLRTP